LISCAFNISNSHQPRLRDKAPCKPGERAVASPHKADLRVQAPEVAIGPAVVAIGAELVRAPALVKPLLLERGLRTGTAQVWERSVNRIRPPRHLVRMMGVPLKTYSPGLFPVYFFTLRTKSR
jgi:hypothetical protein